MATSCFLLNFLKFMLCFIVSYVLFLGPDRPVQHIKAIITAQEVSDSQFTFHFFFTALCLNLTQTPAVNFLNKLVTLVFG